MRKYSDRARRGATHQLKKQLEYFQQNLANREKSLKKSRMYAKYKLPGYKQNMQREVAGIKQIRKIIVNTRRKILKMQREGKINKIL